MKERAESLRTAVVRDKERGNSYERAEVRPSTTLEWAAHDLKAARRDVGIIMKFVFRARRFREYVE